MASRWFRMTPLPRLSRSGDERGRTMITLAQAKDLLRIHEIWRQLDLPGDPKTSCKCPWREDRHASLSISPDGRLFNDFATGQGGDAIDFLQLATGFSRQEACSRFREMAGDFGSTESTAIKIRALPSVTKRKANSPSAPTGHNDGA